MPIVTEKAAIQSKTIWGALLGFIPITLDLLNSAQDILHALPPTIDGSSVAAAVGTVIVVLTKISKYQSQVTGIITPKNEQVPQ